MAQNKRSATVKMEKSAREDDLLKLEAKYCSWGDTVHYMKNPNIFADCRGSFLYDSEGVEYLDLQMLYSAVNFGYKNERVNNAMKAQVDRLPHLACQYLHKEKILLAANLAQRSERTFE